MKICSGFRSMSLPRMPIKRLVLAGCLTPFLAAVLAASTINLSVLPYAPDYENDGSNYVGLTQGYFTSDGSQSSDFWMYCVDYVGTISIPTAYDITAISLDPTDPGSFSDPILNLSLQQLRTQYLLGQSFGSSPSDNSAEDSDIQHAIWSFTGWNVSLDANASGLLNTAECESGLVTAGCGNISQLPSSAFSGAYLLDVTGTSGQQAFMTVARPPDVSTDAPLPEPATFLMSGTGVGLLAFLARRSRRSSATIR